MRSENWIIMRYEYQSQDISLSKQLSFITWCWIQHIHLSFTKINNHELPMHTLIIHRNENLQKLVNKTFMKVMYLIMEETSLKCYSMHTLVLSISHKSHISNVLYSSHEVILIKLSLTTLWLCILSSAYCFHVKQKKFHVKEIKDFTNFVIIVKQKIKFIEYAPQTLLVETAEMVLCHIFFGVLVYNILG